MDRLRDAIYLRCVPMSPADWLVDAVIALVTVAYVREREDALAAGIG